VKMAEFQPVQRREAAKCSAEAAAALKCRQARKVWHVNVRMHSHNAWGTASLNAPVRQRGRFCRCVRNAVKVA